MKTKSRMIIFSLLFWGVFINIALIGSVSASTVNVTSTMNNSQIQSVLDDASSGDTINFLGKFYENIQLTINKTLNIITSVGTVLSGSNSSDSAVFLINGSKASGTTISGFNITNSRAGVVINSTSNTTLMNNSIISANGSAVTINKSSGTYIKNNNMTGSATGITVADSKNTTITKNRVTNNTNGVTISNSADTTLKQDNLSYNAGNGVGIYNSVNTAVNDSTIRNNKNNGFEISKSNKTIINSSKITYNSANGVYVESSDKFKVSDSNISNNYYGVSLKGVSNATVKNNTIKNNYLHGVFLSGSIKTSFVTGNLITENGNGIKVDCSLKNLTISGNTITNSVENGGAREEVGHGVSFGSNYIYSPTLKLEHNIILNNQHRDIDSHDSPYTSYIGSNFYGSDPFICGAITTETSLVVIRTGENTYVAFFLDGDTGEIESDFPATEVTFTTSEGYLITIDPANGGATGYPVTGKDTGVTGTTGQGLIWLTVTFNDSTPKGTLTATAYDISVTIDLNSAYSVLPAKSDSSYSDWSDGYIIPDDPIYVPAEPVTPDKPSGPGGPEGPEGPDGPGGSGNNHTNNPSSSNSTNGTRTNSVPNTGTLALTAAAQSAGSSAGDAGSNSAGSSNSKTAHELFIDNTVKNPTLWSIIGIIVLIVVIFGVYYRNDLMNMIKKSK